MHAETTYRQTLERLGVPSDNYIAFAFRARQALHPCSRPGSSWVQTSKGLESCTIRFADGSVSTHDLGMLAPLHMPREVLNSVPYMDDDTVLTLASNKLPDAFVKRTEWH